MAIEVKMTSDWTTNGIKMLVYGPTGIGKTYTIATCPNPFIINVKTENGLLSLRNNKIPYATIESIDDLEEIMTFLQQENVWDNFDTLCVDSLSEVAEVCLAEQKEKIKDGRRAYAEMADAMMEKIRTLITIPGKNLYCICRQKILQDDDGRILFSPDVPGKSFAKNIPYYFDEVLAFRIMKDSQSGEMKRYIQTYQDEKYDAKDRSGNLNMFEDPNITEIINKI